MTCSKIFENRHFFKFYSDAVFIVNNIKLIKLESIWFELMITLKKTKCGAIKLTNECLIKLDFVIAIPWKFYNGLWAKLLS